MAESEEDMVVRSETELTNGAGPHEVWVGLPKAGERLEGLSRAHIYNILPYLKTANLRKPGKLTGRRLIWLPSLLAYIEKFVETSAEGEVSKPEKHVETGAKVGAA